MLPDSCAICGSPLSGDVTAKDGKCTNCWRSLFPPLPQPSTFKVPKFRKKSWVDYASDDDDNDDDDE